MFALRWVKEIGSGISFRKIIRNDYSAIRQLSGEKKVQNHPEEGQSYFESEKKLSIFKVFATKRNTYLELHKYNPMTISSERISEWKESRKREAEISRQRYIKERHAILGSDLATAHFVVYRDGKIKFKNSDNWIEKHPDEDECPELPNKYVRNLYLEAIDSSNTLIRYEGLENFINLKHLKWLSFKNCIHVDDWFVDRLSGELKETLEYLDLSNCHNLTKNCISCFYRFKKLKTLVLQNVVKNKDFEFSCMLLEDACPHVFIDNRIIV
ncbi:distal membrane-arm assembly complex protein 2 isoform X1 [Rhodnius prolixus]